MFLFCILLFWIVDVSDVIVEVPVEHSAVEEAVVVVGHAARIYSKNNRNEFLKRFKIKSNFYLLIVQLKLKQPMC